MAEEKREQVRETMDKSTLMLLLLIAQVSTSGATVWQGTC